MRRLLHQRPHLVTCQSQLQGAEPRSAEASDRQPLQSVPAPGAASQATSHTERPSQNLCRFRQGVYFQQVRNCHVVILFEFKIHWLCSVEMKGDSEWWIGNDVGGNGRAWPVLKSYWGYSSGVTEENTNLLSQADIRNRFLPNTKQEECQPLESDVRLQSPVRKMTGENCIATSFIFSTIF
jgi:hypothetical protein